MRIVVLSACDAPDVFLIRALRAAFGEVGVFRIVWDGPEARATSSVWSKVSLSKIAARLESAGQGWRDRRLRRRTARILFGDAGVPEVEGAIALTAHRINQPESVERVRAEQPDVLVVSGAPILAPAIFDIARVASLNIHFGVAPAYRGEHTLFWALYRGDHENVGVTLHHISDRIDGGRIVAVGYPALRAGVTEAELMAECARLAADLLIDFLRSGHVSRSTGQAQQTRGRLFLRRERTLWRDAHYWIGRQIRAARAPSRSSDSVRHYDTKSDIG